MSNPMGRHLEVKDLPADSLNRLPGFKRVLVHVYNRSRGKVANLHLLRNTLKFVLAAVEHNISQLNKASAKAKKAKTKGTK